MDELLGGDRKTIEERIHAAAQKDLRATRVAISVFARVVSRAIRYFPHEQIMRAGLLMSLNGAFEVLLSDILHLFYVYFPGALESEEKNYSLKDLRSFKSMDEFFNHVIENRVDTFLRQSLTDWARFFQQRKIDMTKFAPSWEDFAEYFQRRHVIVHNGGRVSRQYLERVAASWLEQHAEETRLGNVLTVSSDYLDGAFNSFELVGSLLSQECWKRFLPKEREDRDSTLCHHQYECLVEARWNVAEALGSWSISEGDMTSKGALITRINRWLSIKRQGRWSEIESEVLGFDYSILDPRYIAAIQALTGNNDLFFSVLPKAGISEDDLRSWPILEEMRQDPRFEDFIEKAKTETKA